MTGRVRREQGSAAVETAVVAPALVALLLLVVLAGRVAQTEGDVRRAAADAARAASMRQYPSAAEDAARDVATADLEAAGVGCATMVVDVDTSDFHAGGSVAVTVRCTASLSDVALLGVPGQREFVARSVAVVDRYRGGAL